MSSYDAPSTDVPHRGWFARNWLWFIPAITLLPPLLCVGCCSGVFSMVIGTLRNAEPFTIAMERINNNDQITARLSQGEPIEADLWGFNGQYNASTDGGAANYAFQIRGEQGAAQVYFDAYHDGQDWNYQVFDVTMPDGDVISLAD